jgi:hypothetical protein
MDEDFSDFDAPGAVEDLGSDSFGEEDFGAADFGDDDGAVDMEDFGDFGGDFDSGDFGDEFSMGDFGAEFGIMEDESAALIDEETPASPEAEAIVDEALEDAEAHDEAADYAISEEQFDSLKKASAICPSM